MIELIKYAQNGIMEKAGGDFRHFVLITPSGVNMGQVLWIQKIKRKTTIHIVMPTRTIKMRMEK